MKVYDYDYQIKQLTRLCEGWGNDNYRLEKENDRLRGLLREKAGDLKRAKARVHDLEVAISQIATIANAVEEVEYGG